MHAESLCLLRLDGDGDRTLPRIFGLLNYLHIGARNLADVYTATDEQVNVERVRTLDVAPSGHHQQRARDVADAAWAHVPGRALCVDQRIRVAEVLPLHINGAEERVVHRLLVQVRVLGVVICEVHLVLEEDDTAARAGFAVGFVPKRVVQAEAFGRFATTDSTGDVVLLVDHVVPEREHSALVVLVMCLGRDVGHAGVEVHGADRMPDGLVLLDRRRMALVVLLAARLLAAAVDEELRERNIAIAVAAALLVVNKAAKANECLLHLLVPVIPLLLTRADVC